MKDISFNDNRWPQKLQTYVYTNVHNIYTEYTVYITSYFAYLEHRTQNSHLLTSIEVMFDIEILKITHRYCISVIQSDVVVLSATNFTHHTTTYVWSVVASASCHLALGCIYGEEECNCERIVSKHMYLKKGKRVCQLCVFIGTHKVW